MSTTPAQLSFALNNLDAPSTVYVSANVADNSLSLVITTNVASTFTAGTVVSIDDAEQGTGSLLYLDLSQLGLTDAEFDALSLDGTDWQWVGYTSTRLIGFSPASTLSLAASSSFTLSLNDFSLATLPSSATVQLSVTYFRVTGVTQNSIPMTGNFAVAVSYPPDDHDMNLQAAILASLSPAEVVNSPAGESTVNTLMLTLSPGATPAVINATAETIFTLTFVYDDKDTNGYGALMTTEQVQPTANFAVSAGTNAGGWTITPVTSAQSPFWTLSPPVGSSIIGSGTLSTVAFNITGLVTTFQPGPTVVLLAYQNVPGYADGTYSILVQKYPHVVVENFSVTPEQSVLVNGLAEVTLSWTDEDATTLTLYLTSPSSQSAALAAASATIINVTGKTSYTTQISNSTQFVMIAEGQSPDNSVSNQTIVTSTAYIEPAIEEFSISPQYINQGAQNTCLISWAINAPADTAVTLSSSLTGPDGVSHALTGKETVELSQAQQFTLTATPQSGYPIVSQTDTVFIVPIITAFGVSPETITLAAPNNYTLSWSITADSSTTVTISGSVNGQIASGLSLAGSLQTQLLRPQTLTLSASAPGGDPTTQSNITMIDPGLLATNYTPSITSSSNQTPGQQVTMPTGGPWTQIKFNFFNTASSSPYALGDLYLLTQAYSGTPSSLSSKAGGFVAKATAANNQWSFSSSVSLKGGTSYYFYMNTHPPQGTAATYPNAASGFQGYGSANGTDGFLTRPFQIQYALYGS